MTKDFKKELAQLDENLNNFDFLKDITDEEAFGLELRRAYIKGYLMAKTQSIKKGKNNVKYKN
jgi:hypothetical protein